MRLVVGVLIWLAILIGSIVYFKSNRIESTESNQQLISFLTKSRQQFDVNFEGPAVLKIGDPIIISINGTAEVVGNVTAVSKDNPDHSKTIQTKWASIEFFSDTPMIVQGDFLSYHQTPDSMDWVVQMMLPPKKRQEIGGLIIDAYRKHYSDIAAALQPIIVKSLKEATEIVKEDFYKAIAKREQEIADLGNRFQVELVEEELIPMVKDEIWPIVQEKGIPLATTIGEEIWQHASVWRFGWRFVYDRSPLPERNLVQKEFQRFLESHGIPVIESHLPKFMEVQQNVLKQASENEKVQQVVANASMKVLRDPEFQKLTAEIMKDVFINNERLIAVFEKNWKSSEANAALELTNKRLEPTVTRIGQSLFGSPQQSITPEFSRILRNRILNKDDRWLVLHLADKREPPLKRNETIPAKIGETGTENPFHIPARTKF